MKESNFSADWHREWTNMENDENEGIACLEKNQRGELGKRVPPEWIETKPQLRAASQSGTH